MKKKITAVLALSSVLAFYAATASAMITTNYDMSANPASWDVVESIAGWATTSDYMTGMKVTATFAGSGSSQSVLWTGATGAVGTGWSLALTNPAGSTFSTPFMLNAWDGVDIVSLLLEGVSGNVAFDVDPSVELTDSTFNSLDGVPFTDSYVDAWGNTITSSVVYSGVDITAYYSSPIALVGETPLYDLYSNLLLTFTGLTEGEGFTSSSSLTFISDTDTTVNPVPEPATIILFGSGLACMGLLVRRKKN